MLGLFAQKASPFGFVHYIILFLRYLIVFLPLFLFFPMLVIDLRYLLDWRREEEFRND